MNFSRCYRINGGEKLCFAPNIICIFLVIFEIQFSAKKNLISKQLIELRKRDHLSQRDLSHKLQLAGYDMGKNVITRIKTNKRYVTDIELRAIAKLFDLSYEYLIDGKNI